MFDDFVSHRVQGWRVDHLSSDEKLLSPLRGVDSGSVTLNEYARIHGGGYLKVREALLARPIDWGRDRMRVYVVVNGKSYPMGTFRIDKPSRSGGTSGVFRQVVLSDKLSIFDQSETSKVVTFGTSKPVTEMVEKIIRDAGERSLAVVDSPTKLKSAVTFEPGEPWLNVINKLLDAIGYKGLSCDAMGRFVIAPYVSPGKRPLLWTFQRGSRAIHKAEWSQEQEFGSVPNRVILHTTGDEDEPGMVAVAENRDPKSPYSYQARGNLWVDKSEVVEAADQKTLQAMAERRLLDSSRPPSSLTLRHAFLPLWGGERYGFRSEGISTSGTVHEFTLSFGVDDLLMQTVLREVGGGERF